MTVRTRSVWRRRRGIRRARFTSTSRTSVKHFWPLTKRGWLRNGNRSELNSPPAELRKPLPICSPPCLSISTPDGDNPEPPPPNWFPPSLIHPTLFPPQHHTPR